MEHQHAYHGHHLAHVPVIPTGKITEAMGASPRWIRRLCARPRDADLKDAMYPVCMGRPSTACSAGRIWRSSPAVRHRIRGQPGWKRDGGGVTGVHISHSAIHDILRGEDMARTEPTEGGRRKWMRHASTHSNSLWSTDYRQLDDGRWFLSYEDDTPRFVTGWGVFVHATRERSGRAG